MQEVDLDPDSKSDIETFNKVVRPLKGEKASNPLNLRFIGSSKVDNTVYYRFSRNAFDISESILRSGIVDLLEGKGAEDLENRREMEQLLYLCYGNASQTARYKPRARRIISYLIIEGGEVSKEELMEETDLDPSSESDDRRFRRTMQYLKGSWDSERKNPLHTENHGFVVSMRMEGSTSYYRVSPGEFKRAMNVVVKNIRSYIDTETSERILQLHES